MVALARCNRTSARVLLHALRAGSRRVLLSDPGLFRPWGQVSQEAKDMLHRWALLHFLASVYLRLCIMCEFMYMLQTWASVKGHEWLAKLASLEEYGVPQQRW